MTPAPAWLAPVALTGLLAVGVPAYLLWPATVAVKPLPPLVQTRLDLRPLTPLTSAIEQPLFTPDRAPAPLEAETAAAPPPTPAPTLVGLIADGRGGGVALLQPMGGKTESLRVGETLAAWRLVAVNNGSATLSNGAQTVTADLRFAGEGAMPDPTSDPSDQASHP